MSLGEPVGRVGFGSRVVPTLLASAAHRGIAVHSRMNCVRTRTSDSANRGTDPASKHSMDGSQRTRRPSSPRSGKWLLPGIAGAVLVGGLVAILVAFDVGGIRGSAEPGPATRNESAAVAKKLPKVPLEPEARRVAGRFILTAVARKHLAESYALAAPKLRQGLTLAQWKTGNIPVVPYPTEELKPVRMSVKISTGTHANIMVFLDPRPGAEAKSQIFIIELDKIGTRWFVSTWVPFNPPAIPLSTS